jgi:hypothetical protein
MSTPTLATAGGALLDIGYSGQIANAEESSIFSLDNETTTTTASTGIDLVGTMDFGIAVARGTLAGCCKVITADSDLPIGITVRHPTMVSTSGGIVGYATSKPVPIAYLGDLYVKAYEAVNAGDQVISVTAQGGKLSGPKSGVVGSGRVLVPNCHWVNAVASGAVGLVRLTGINNPRTTT